MASQFQFQALQLVNITDIDKSVKHDLAEESFKAGQKEFTLKDLQDIVEELNQRASSGRRNRNHELMKKLPSDEADQVMARKSLPLTQAVMINITKKLRHEWGIKVVWFAAGKQDEIRMMRDGKMWSNQLVRPREAGNAYDQVFGNARKLNDLIEKDAPLTFITPAPSMGGLNRRHKIKPDPADVQLWEQNGTRYAERMHRKFDCHIRQQKIDTFLVSITTVHNSDYEVIKQYLTKWEGNYLFIR